MARKTLFLIAMLMCIVHSLSASSPSNLSGFRRRLRPGEDSATEQHNFNAASTSGEPTYAEFVLDQPHQEDITDSHSKVDSLNKLSEKLKGYRLLEDANQFFLDQSGFLNELTGARLDCLDAFQALLAGGMVPLNSFDNYANIPTDKKGRSKFKDYQSALDKLHSNHEKLIEMKKELDDYYYKFQHDQHLIRLHNYYQSKPWPNDTKREMMQLHSDVRKIIYWTQKESLSQPNRLIEYYRGQMDYKQVIDIAKKEANEIENRLAKAKSVHGCY